MDSLLCDKKTRYLSLIRINHGEYIELKNKLELLMPKFNRALHDLTSELTDKYNNEHKNNDEIKEEKIRFKNEKSDKDNKPVEDDEVEIDFQDEGQFDINRNVVNELNEKETIESRLEKFINKLYYKISIHIHPDKTDDEIKIAYFDYCKKSKEDKILYKLILVAEKFNIEYRFLDDYYEIVDNEIKIVKFQIKNMKDNIVFLWENTENEDLKREILLKYMQRKMK